MKYEEVRPVTLSWFFSREGEKPKNPMVELFYGRFLAVGVHEGETGRLIETNKEKKAAYLVVSQRNTVLA